LAELRRARCCVLPSMLLCDFGHLAEEIERLEAAGVAALHLDVMDGHFVPNLTYGPTIVAAIRGLTSLLLDVHLMISDPDTYVSQFCQAGADSITIHVEAVQEPRSLLERIRNQGIAAGIALNPSTPVTAVESCLDACDLVLPMSVEPGFGGQQFNPIALDKLRRLKEICPPETLLEVDGGVNQNTINQCAAAGADLFVVGSAISRHDDYSARIKTLTDVAHHGNHEQG